MLLKSTFFEIFENFDQNRNYSENFTKNVIFENLAEIEIFRKFWPKSKFFENLTKIDYFRKFDQNRYFSKI